MNDPKPVKLEGDPKNYVNVNSKVNITKKRIEDIKNFNTKLKRMCDNLYYCFYNHYNEIKEKSDPTVVDSVFPENKFEMTEDKHIKRLKKLLGRVPKDDIVNLVNDAIKEIKKSEGKKESDGIEDSEIVAMVEIQIDKIQKMKEPAIADKFETKKLLSKNNFDELESLSGRAQWLKEYGNIIFKYLDEKASGNIPPPPEDPPPVW